MTIAEIPPAATAGLVSMQRIRENWTVDSEGVDFWRDGRFHAWLTSLGKSPHLDISCAKEANRDVLIGVSKTCDFPSAWSIRANN